MIKLKLNTASCILYCILIPQCLALECDLNADMFLTKGCMISGDSSWEFKTRDAVECARSCIRAKQCQSFNFNTSSALCQLYFNPRSRSTTEVNMMCSDFADLPSQVDPSCYTRPCADGEICIPGGVSCSHSCFPIARSCPFLPGSMSGQSRTVGSIFTHTCGPKFVGGDSALCLPSGEWNKTIDTSCKPLYESSCTKKADCEPINGICDENACVCGPGLWYLIYIDECAVDCEAGWVRFEKRCYLIGKDSMTFKDAMEFCSANGSQVVYIESAAENSFLVNEMKREAWLTTGYYFWNGLYQFSKTSAEKWWTNDGQLEPTFLYWQRNEPNRLEELCTVAFSMADFMWLDVLCSHLCRPVCKK